nr:reverse transcriptase domain-containing protein [Tanacetum cinerariifolium]
MRTRSKSYPNNSNATIPRRQNRKRVPNIFKPEIHTIEEVVPMADRTMEELLQAGREMLRVCPHHGFSELTQIDTFYNGLNEQDQDSLNAASGGNLLSKTTRDALKITKNKSKVHYSRSKSNVSRVNTDSRESSSKTDDRIDKLADQISNLVEIVNKQVITFATVKAVEKSCVICGGAHDYYDCIATDSNQSIVCATTASTLGTLPSNTIPNPKGEIKVVTTRNGLAYKGPSIPTNSSLEKVVERETEETTDKEKPNCQGIKVLLNENFSAILLKKLPKNLGDSGKFLIPCDFPGMDVCHALADLDASINLMPVSIWKKLSLPKLTPTRMTLELADRSITLPKGVGSLILRRSFLRIGRALIDVYGEEITLRVNDESVTFNLNQTMRYSSTYDDNSVNRIDVIAIAYEEFAQDVLDFKYNSKSKNPTLVSNPSFSEETKSEFCKEPIVKSSSPILTPFGESDFFLEEIEDFLKDESIPTGIEDSCYDLEGDILYLVWNLNGS